MNSPIRAEIFDTGNPKIKSARIVIDASAESIFSLLTNPQRHMDFDGSKTIQGNFSGPTKLELGSKFGMQMKLGINHRIFIVIKFKMIGTVENRNGF
jgi:hypothetical protein